ncbi:MucB/RseB C-terminal domain-containing protein [Thalassolituus oleivorans]|uniref:MucB/RseB C-terminal domain-containing protein n=1 Tax=Thalassolituus oleivorans TaxID=187493 RepID=UPI001CE36B61|nr:MucB/RseB C-terminal domain-containing protein [Thalassolituus oleivorans]MCA6127079.1 hypothetical protein [Thalassolituus oleivorans 4BN06-13]MDF1639804.1 MucB/RseB C-terminal domain-containing protein [Thalassolituus oleivorans]
MIARLLLVICCLSGAAHAESDPQQEQNARVWLDKMSRALNERNYQGVLIYGDPSAWDTLSIKHSVIDGTEYEKLEHLTGLPRKIIRRGHDITCIHPGDHVVRTDPNITNPLTQSLVLSSSELTNLYDLQVGGHERIADRIAQRINVLPKDKYRYGYSLWVDMQSGLLLRSDLLSERGEVLERFQFAQVEIDGDIPISEFDDTDAGHRIEGHGLASETGMIQPALWEPGWIPRGFMMTTRHEQEQAAQHHQTMVMYTDGLAAFTLFVDNIADSRMPDMNKRWGATAAVVRHMKFNDNGYRITVVGEVPMATVQKIALSVRPILAAVPSGLINELE